MPVAIKIPVRTHISSFGASIVKLQRTVEEMCNCGDSVISLDFSDTRILNPFYLGGLVCVIDRLTAEGKQITLNHDSNHFIRSYLSTIYFPFCLVPQPGAYNLAYYSKKTYLPIIKLPTGAAQTQELAREKVLSAVTDLFKSQLSLTGNDLAPMAYLVSELSNNIRDHSGMDNGYVFAQYYPQSSYLDLCICDAGKGIFESFTNNPNHHPNTELEALKFALNGRSTKDAYETRGFGLPTSRDILVNGLNGKFFIWTGNTTYMQDIDNDTFVVSDQYHFQGTYVALRIPTIIPKGFNIYNFLG